MAIDFCCSRCGCPVSLDAGVNRANCLDGRASTSVPTRIDSPPRPKLPPRPDVQTHPAGAADGKREALAFLKTVRAAGTTDVLPAIRRAFPVLDSAPGSRKRRVICLLTDGEFIDNNRVADTIRKINGRGTVCINTIPHHYRSPAATRVLKQIAADNQGEIRFAAPGS